LALRRTAGLLAIATAMIAAIPLATRADESVLRVSLNTELQILDPIVTSINATRVFAYLVFDMLVGIDRDGHYHPQMLQGWQISDDRLTYTFQLRDGLVWSDGTPVTAQDCVASIRRWAKREPIGAQLMDATQDISVTDPKTFVLHLKRPFAFVIDALGKPGSTIPVMMPERLAALDASTAVPEIVGSGPFVFHTAEWRPGERAIFHRNPLYKPRAEPADGLSGGKTVRFDRVDLISEPDQATRVAALQTGELDFLEIVPFDYIDALRRDPNVTVAAQRGVEQMMSAININHAQPPFNNVLIRRALQAAIGQDDVMASLGLPPDMYLRQCYSIYMCDSPGTTDAGTEVFHSAGIDRARALLREAGYHNEPVVLLHSANTVLLNPTGLVIADQMRQAGFNVDVRTSDYATAAQRRLSRAPVDQGGWSVVPIVWNGIDLLNPLSNPAVSNNCNDKTPGWYCDPKMTDLLRRYAVAATADERHQLAAEIQEAFISNVDYVLAGQSSAPAAYRSDLRNVIPFAFPVFWNIERK
jgi:peptide/nickel transport system substrate-binding protein